MAHHFLRFRVFYSLTLGTVASLLPLSPAVTPTETFAHPDSSSFYSSILSSLRSINPAFIGPHSPKLSASACSQPQSSTDFLVMAGGGAPSYNEIALEKNVLYFQRTLQAMKFDPTSASIYFANGKDGKATVRYMDGQQQKFKPPEIPNLSGAATLSNFQNWFQETARREAGNPGDRSIFFYFTGHGFHNRADENNNALVLWGEQLVSVQQFVSMLDTLPQKVPIVTMMSQCYAGAFANFIYEGGDPSRPIALQTRCGFFATIKSRTSVGCTPEVNEADYRDYSSSFFAGLSGRSRTGEAVASADYNHDGKVSYAEAHAFAKVDEHSTDLPVSTVEVWLQDQASEADQQRILNQPIADFLSTTHAERKYVVNTLMNQFKLDQQKSFYQNLDALKSSTNSSETAEIEEAYLVRLGMEIVDIAMEQKIRQAQDRSAIATLDRLNSCENGSWK